MKFQIAVIPGDGIGPEVIAAARQVLDAIAQRFGHQFCYTEIIAGGASLDRFDTPLLPEELNKAKASDAVLLGAVGGPKWDTLPASKRPENALFALRSELGLFANLRPAVMFAPLRAACPLKRCDTLDILIVRELTGGIYFGAHQREGDAASDVMRYTVPEITRIAHVAFRAARRRSRRVVSVDKANVLACSRLWREVLHAVAAEYPDVEYSDMLVDNCAMQLVRDPGQFDVIVTENMFGDILSDEAAMLTGSLGLLPSSSMGEGTFGMFEPVHGSAPDIAGRHLANPIAAILSAAMMLRDSFALSEEAACVERAVSAALARGKRTADLANGATACTTEQMTDAILAEIRN